MVVQPVIALTEEMGYLSPAFRYLMASHLGFHIVADKYRIEGERQLQKRPEYAEILHRALEAIK